MKRLIALLSLVFAFVLCTHSVRAQTAFINSPDTICAGSFATLNGLIWENSVTVSKMTWSVNNSGNMTFIAGNLGTMYPNDGSLNNGYPGVTAMTVRIDTVGTYTFQVVITDTKGRTYTTSHKIVVRDCTINQCNSNIKSNGVGFVEDFGTVPIGGPRQRSPYVDGATNPYLFSPSGDPADNYYAIYYTSQLKSDWVDFGDHTQNGDGVTTLGGMLVCNSSIEKKSFYRRQVDGLCPGSNYNFYAFFLNINSAQTINSICARASDTKPNGYHYAGVTFVVKDLSGTILKTYNTGDVSMNLAGPQWQRYGGTFKTTTGSVIVEIVNNNYGGCGNDIAIDDITFEYCPPKFVTQVDGVPNLTTARVCEGAPLSLTAQFLPADYFTNPIYQWQMSTDQVTWTTITNGPNVTGATTSNLQMGKGFLVGNPLDSVYRYFRMSVTESGNPSTCAAPSMTIKVTILPAPKVTVSSGEVCLGDAVTLTASGGYSKYNWVVSPPYSGPSYTTIPTTTTTYQAAGIAVYGNNKTCTDTGQATVIVDTLPIVKITATPPAICAGQAVSLSIPNSNAPFDIVWSSGATTYANKTVTLGNITLNTPGTTTFNVQVTNKKCVVKDQLDVQVFSQPTATANPDLANCNSGTFTVTGNTPPTGQTGVWTFLNGVNKGAQITNPNATSTTVTNVPSGDSVKVVWTVTNSGKTDCVAADTIRLWNVPALTPAQAMTPIVQCGAANNSFNLNATAPARGESGKWTAFDANNNPVTTVIFADATKYNTVATVPNTTMPASFRLLWTITNGVCTNVDTASVWMTLKKAPTVQVSTTSVCSNSSTFDVNFSNVTGTIKQYSVAVNTGSAAARQMPAFTTINGNWPAAPATKITLPLPANTPSGKYDFVLSVKEDTLLGCTYSVPFSLSVETPSQTPTKVKSSIDSICKSGSATLTVTGQLGTDSNNVVNAKWKWYTGACPGNPGSVAVTPATSNADGSIVTFNNITATTTYYVRAETNAGGACGASGCASALVVVIPQPNIAATGGNLAACNQTGGFTLNGNATGVAGLNGMWTSLNPRAVITNPTSPNGTVTVPVGDTATLVWTIASPPCLTTSATTFINNYAVPAVRTAGTKQEVCNQTTFTMNAGAPTEIGAVGTWTANPAAGVTITNINDPKTTVTVPAGSDVKFTWSIANPKCSANGVDTVHIINYVTPAKQTAGTKQEVCDQTTFTMNAGAPTEFGAIGTWTANVTTGVTITDIHNPKTTVTVPAGSDVKFTWTITNPKCAANGADTVHIINYVTPAKQGAGSKQEVCNQTSFTMNANAPTEFGAIGTWTATPAAGVTITNVNDPKTTVTVPVGSDVKFTWTITNPKCAANGADTVHIINYVTPAKQSAGSKQEVCNQTTFTMNANAPTEFGAIGTWTSDVTTGVTITDIHNPKTTVTVPAGSDVKFTWTITNPKCAANGADTVHIINYVTPAKQGAGSKQEVCNQTSFTMNANAPTEFGAIGTWTSNVTTGVTITDIHNPKTTVTVPAGSDVRFTWTITNPICAAVGADTVHIINYVTPAKQGAGSKQEVCNQTSFTMNANAPTEFGAIGTWTSDVTTGVTITDIHNPKTTVTVPAGSDVKFTWTISNPKCAANGADTVHIINYVTPAKQTAGSKQEVCNQTTFTMNAGAPTEFGAIGTWTSNVTTGVTITDIHNPKTTVTVPAGSDVKFTWTITNPKCAANGADTVHIINYVTPAKQGAGSKQEVCNQTSFTMNANAPTEFGAIGTWTANVTTGVTITDIHNPKTTVTVPAGSDVKFTWTITNPICAAVGADTVHIINYVTPAKQSAGTKQEVCNQTSFTMNANAPTEFGAIGTWTANVTTGVTITDIHNPKTTVTVPAGSDVKFTWTITNPICAAVGADTVHIINYVTPAKQSAGSKQEVCNQTSFTMNANAPTEFGAIGTWTSNVTTGVTITDIHNPKTTVTVPAGSDVKFTWTITNPKCAANGADTVHIINYVTPAKQGAGSKQEVCNQTTFTMNANAPTEFGAIGTWTANVTTGVTITDTHNPKTTVTVPAGSDVKFTWTITNPICAAVGADTVHIINYVTPAKQSAGTKQEVCNQTTFTMNAGTPTEFGAIGTWTSNVTTGVTITDIHNPKTTVTVPAGSDVRFTWTITNPICAAVGADTVHIINYVTPAKQGAGSKQEVCNQTSFTMNANAPTEFGAIGTWTSDVTTGVTITDIHNPKTTVTVPAGSDVKFTWTISNPKCAANGADTVHIINYVTPAKQSAGTKQEVCNQTTFTMNAGAPTEFGAIGTWTSNVTTGVTITDIHNPKTTVTVPAGSDVRFTWTITNPICAAVGADTVHIINYVTPAKQSAGTKQEVCNQTTFTMNANAPTEFGAIGTWTANPATGVTITDTHNPKTTVTVPAGSDVKFTWTITNPICAATGADTVHIINYVTPAKQSAGTKQEVCNQTTFNMNANAPTEFGAIGTWTANPAAGVTIVDIHNPKTSVTVPAGSDVKFTWTITNPKCAANGVDTVHIINYIKPSYQNAGSSQQACDITTFTMNALPPTEFGAIGTWTASPATGVTIVNKNDPKTSVTIPAGSTVVFTWTISNPVCSADRKDSVKITSYIKPVVRDAGSNQQACDITTFTMNAEKPAEYGAIGTWTASPATGVTIANANDPKTSVTIPAGSSVVFTWTITNPVCAADKTDTVRITSYIKPVVRKAGSNQEACDITTFTMNATAPTEFGAIGTWSASPAAGVIIGNVNDPKTSVTIPAGSSVVFTWSITNPVCAASQVDTVKITSYIKPVMRSAGTAQKACDINTFTMNATAPTEYGAVGTWTASPATGVTIADIHNPKTAVTIPAGSTVLFKWSIANSACAASNYDTVRLTSYKMPAKAVAGPAQAQCNNAAFTMKANAPVEFGAIGTWTISGSAPGVVIADIHNAATGVTVPAGAAVTLKWTISNGTCIATTDSVLLTNYALAANANAGPDQRLCNQTADFIMAANAPGVPTAIGAWTDISRIPGRATIKSPNNPATAVTVPIGDTVILKWTITNGVCASTSSVVTLINYQQANTAAAGPDQEKCNSTADFIMAANNTGSSSAIGTWTDISRIPGRAVIKSPNNPASAVTVPIGDTVILKWTITNGTCASTSSVVTLINYQQADNAKAGPDQQLCSSTADFIMKADPPSVASGKGFWSLVKGNAIIRQINDPKTGVNVNIGDTVTLRWTITNGSCSATWDDVTLINYMTPAPANAGSNQEHCDQAAFTMNASAPGVPGAKGLWTITSANASLITISNVNDPKAIINVPAGETAQLNWVVSNGVCATTTSSVTLINRKPILGNNITADQTVCASETPAALSGSTLSGGNSNYTYQWQQSTSANGTFTNINGAVNDTYQPGTLTQDTWFRRLVTSGACINNASNVVKITVVLKAPVVVSTPASFTTECVRGADYTTMFGTPVFSHAPYNNVPLTITYNDVTTVNSPCNTTITRTWTAADRCGFTVTASQTITVTDTKAPVFKTAAPADTLVDCDKVPAQVSMTATDDCAGDIIIPVVEVRKDIPGACSSNYQLIRTWTAKDACNTGVTLTQVITVKDMTAPVFNMSTPADTTVDCDKVPNGMNLTATDNCTPGIITVTPKDSVAHSANNCASNYLIFRKWTAFDQCGNARAVQQIIRVQDTTKPVFSMPAPKDTTVDCDKVPGWPQITASDNCSGNVQVLTNTRTVKVPGAPCANQYQEIRSWTATDDCGNRSFMQQVITVQDTTRPVFTVLPPADTTVSCDAIPAPALNVAVSDNCSSIGNGLSFTRSTVKEQIPGDCSSNYRIIRTWTATDACGNATSIRQMITVKDTTRPVIEPAPADVVIYCQDQIPAPPVLNATDNCDGTFPKRAIYSEDPFVKDICNGYTIIRRWTITDACGNKANDVIQRVIIKPCAKPQLNATLPVNCSDNPRVALQPVGDVSLPSFTLVAVTPANAVTGLPITKNSNVFNLNGATSASFIITDGNTGCSSDTMTYNLKYNQKPVVHLGNDTTICGGNSLVLDAGAANFAYPIKWSTGETTQRINITQAGTYWVNVSNGECSTTDSIHVSLVPTPLVVIPDTTICRGQTVKLDAYVNGATYLWSNGATTSSILVGTQDQFWVKVTKSGCITIDTVKVSVNPPPDISLSRDTAICPDQSVMLTVNSNGGRIQWQTGETTNSIVVNKPGGYWVAVSRDNCVVKDTVNVRLKPGIKVDLGPDRNICPGAMVTLDGTTPDAVSYLWNDGDPNPVKQITQAGNYKLAVMDRFCQRVMMDSVKVNVTGLPKIDLGPDTTMCKGETLVLHAEGGGITGVRWDNGSSSPTLNVTEGGTYTVTVFNDCGSATDNITVAFVQCDPKPQFPNAFSPNGDGRNDVFRPIVRGPMYSYELRVFNRWGELIFMSDDQHRGWDGTYKGRPVEVGTYVWWLTYKKSAGGNANVLKGEVTVIR
ncbi:T9SS type B sorting domain-containing protein [Chitinophaga vietnamensis]|uniref:T9SS type B sorting domain-containing protein n=1 Tax=Chitinophaga vietnamensis TaxID=2593957 RepID=UPI0011784AC7|nr:gliding motility-associated C-terminal domain-containing protein [Chitinophaga vietnamensis]